MSATKASQESNREGECVVCGKSSALRCSSCSKHGLDWMYFCSADHQRFIWYAHKRTCGIDSMPFQWPYLTEDEKVEWRKLKKLKYPTEEGEVEWETQLAKGNITFDGMLKLYDLEALERVRYTSDLARITTSLVGSRVHKYRIWRHEARRNHQLLETYGNLYRDPYSYLAHQLLFDWPELASLVDKTYEWWTALHHRFLILFAILLQHYRVPDLCDKHTVLIHYAKSQVRKVLREQVSQDFPFESRKLEGLIDSIVLVTRIDPRTGKEVGLWLFRIV